MVGIISDRMQHVHLIDFGLTEMYMDAKTQIHVPDKFDVSDVGNHIFCSVN